MHISHGGLQYGRVRYFDAAAKRPGLPPGVSALVEKLTPDSVTVHLVNTSLFDDREVIIQAGVFGEHRFSNGEIINSSDDVTGTIVAQGKWLNVSLPAGTGITLRLSMERFVHSPSYDMPWPSVDKQTMIHGRTEQ
jgi:hypothetical protein